MIILETRLRDNSIRAFKGIDAEQCCEKLAEFRRHNPNAESFNKQVAIYEEGE